MSTDNAKLSPAQELHAAAMRLKQQLGRVQQRELSGSHGRNVGGVLLPVVREGSGLRAT